MRRGLRALIAFVVAAALTGASPVGAPAAGSTSAKGPPPAMSVEAPAVPSASAGTGTSPAAPVPGPTADPGTAAAPAPLPQPKGKTSFVSVGLVSASAPGYSTTPSISASGRYVAFATVHTSAVAGASFTTSTVYLRDRSAGTTTAIPRPSGSPLGRYAGEPSISADGSVIAFTLGSSDPAAPHSVVVWDRKTGKTTVVSRPNDAPDASSQPAVSGNGRYVAYASTADRLIPGYTSDFSDVWRFDRQTGRTVLVSEARSSAIVKGDSTTPSISADGHLVAFTSIGSTSLAANAVGPGTQVFVRDVDAGTTTQVSIGSDGSAPDGASDEASLSDDGAHLAFASIATTMLGPGGPTTWEVYRRDLATGQNELVSARDDGTPFPVASRQPAISRDGRMVAYVISGASLSISEVSRQNTAILLRDVTAQQTAVITVTPAGALSQSISIYPKVGGSGRYVTFASGGADLVAGDDNGSTDVFIRDMPPIPKLNPPTIDFGTRAVGVTPATAAGVLANAGWGPMAIGPASIAGTNAADFSVLGDGCNGATLYRGDPCTVTVGFVPQQPGARTAKLQIPASAPGSPSVLTLKGRGSQAVIVLNPPIGQQGIVVVATGDHFPANAEIQLTWSVGITPSLPVVKADSHGHWQIQVLVFHHDITGLRNLVATWVGGPEFPTVQVPMLVTVRTVTAPGLNVGAPSSNPLPLLFRG